MAVGDPRLESCRYPAGLVSRHEAIVAGIERNYQCVSNSGAKHLEIGLFQRPKARDGLIALGRGQGVNGTTLGSGERVGKPLLGRRKHRCFDVDADVAGPRDREDRDRIGVRTAEMQVFRAVFEHRLACRSPSETPGARLDFAVHHFGQRDAQRRARRQGTLARGKIADRRELGFILSRQRRASIVRPIAIMRHVPNPDIRRKFGTRYQNGPIRVRNVRRVCEIATSPVPGGR